MGIFIICVAAGEAALALAMVLALGKFKSTVELDDLSEMKLIRNMWIDYRKVNNLSDIAEAYKDLLEAEGLPTRIIPEEGLLEWSELICS